MSRKTINIDSIPETVVLECQRKVYELAEKLTQEGIKLSAAKKLLAKIENDSDYAEKQVRDMVKFLLDAVPDDREKDREEYEAVIQSAMQKASGTEIPDKLIDELLRDLENEILDKVG
jgi:hypothetical protein